ncbi:MAG: TetR/AcrR family transcriptional regulator [Pseudomonadota bacterium]
MSRPQPDSAPYHHGDLRRTLVDRAIAVIEAHGVEAVSLRALARDIGVSHAAPMRHFPTRSALLAAIAKSGIRALLESAGKRLANPELSNVQKLRSMAEGYVVWAAANPAHHMLIRNQDVMRHADRELLEEASTYARLHEDLIRRAQADGWRSQQKTHEVFVEITALTAGLALLASDPIYRTVLPGQLEREEISAVLDRFMGTAD